MCICVGLFEVCAHMCLCVFTWCVCVRIAYVCVSVNVFEVHAYMCVFEGYICVFVSELCVCINMDLFEVLVHICLYVYLCMCIGMYAQGWEVAEEERQRDITSTPSLSSSGKLTGTTDCHCCFEYSGSPPPKPFLLEMLEWKFFFPSTP